MSQTDSSTLKAAPSVQLTPPTEPTYYEDEIDLVHYCQVIWNHKWLILVGTAIPSLLVGLLLYFSPKTYQISYTYNQSLDAKEFLILKDTFYSQENLDFLAQQIHAAGFTEYAEKIRMIQTPEALAHHLQLEATPSFESLTPTATENNQMAKSSFLTLNIFSDTPDLLLKIGALCRVNFEQQIPLVMVHNDIRADITHYKEQMAIIEESRYDLNLLLSRKKAVFEKLKGTPQTGPNEATGNVVLQFSNIENTSEYLPVTYQLQAVETQIINLEEEMREKQERYTYYHHLLDFYQSLYDRIEKAGHSFTLREYRDILVNLLQENHVISNPTIENSLSAYVKRIENRLTSIQPIIQRPKVYSLSKGTLKKAGIIFGISLLLTVFGSFIHEGLQQRRLQCCSCKNP